MTPEVDRAWGALLTLFFGPANRLDWPTAVAPLVELMRLNEQLLDRNPPGPVILPFVGLKGNTTTYYAVAGDDDQARHLGEVITAFVGPTSSNFTGRILQPDPYDQMHGALTRFAGGASRVFSFDVVASERARVQVELRRLLTTWTSRPRRTLGDVVPIGRLLDDFEDALERGDDEQARYVLYEDLLRQGRLSGPNRVFLQARYLAAFERWDVLEQLPDLDDLLRLRRPALVSDALARLALHRLTAIDDSDRLAAFRSHVASRFGALVPSLDVVRSGSSAAYHVLWSLHAGESPDDVAVRLEGTPWRFDSVVCQVLDEVDGHRSDGAAELSAGRHKEIEKALANGLYERVIDLLDAGPAQLPLVATLGRILRETLSLRASEILRRYRAELGETTVQDELDRVAGVILPPDGDNPAPKTNIPEVLSWPEVFHRLAVGDLNIRAAALEEMGFVELLRGDDLDGIVDALETVNDDVAGTVIDQGVTLCRRLEAADCEPDRLIRLRQKLVEVWAIRDGSGQRRRAEALLEQVDKLLHEGVGTADYSELVELLTLGWAPFLTDQAVGFSLATLELLASYRTPGDEKLNAFASMILHRIGPYNAGRIPRADLLVAGALASEFGLQLNLGTAPSAATPETASVRLPSPFVIGLYSLDEPALHRTATLIEREYPGVTVETNSDKVATERLRVMTRRVDILVMAELSSKHAATDAIKAARYPRPYGHAAGKGSTSMLRAVEEQIGQYLSTLVV